MVAILMEGSMEGTEGWRDISDFQSSSLPIPQVNEQILRKSYCS